MDEAEIDAIQSEDSEVLFRLSRSMDWHIRKKVVWNPATSEDILEYLAADPVQWVREAVANSPRISTEILVRLAGDRSGFVRAAVGLNSNAPLETLKDLAVDEMM